MQGAIVEIADHPVTGHKRKVQIHGLGISWDNEVIGLETSCTYYENDNGNFGEPVSIPQPIVIKKTLVAQTSGKVVWVDKTQGVAIVKKVRNIPSEIEGESDIQEEYFVLEGDGVTEVPKENAQELFFFLANIMRTQPVVHEAVLVQFVLDEVHYGTFDMV
jgi:hypothetical protein